MRDTGPVAVTQPSVTTGYAADERRQIALRWVFPSARVSVLHDGHRFGRDTACESVLPGSEISRVHACVRVTSPVPVLQDLGSRNGVFVGGQRVQERPLGPGDVVRLGEWVGILEERTGAQPGTDSELHAIGPGWYGGSTLSAVMEPLRAVAATDLPIAIEGETGTGKEGAARQVHAWSGRRGPLIAVDCGALPEQLAEAQLFGQRKGAFTGADRASLGHLRAADGGTLFLDEVLNLSLPVQAKLLRALETRTVLPIGESQPIPVDFRVICAAQEPMASAVADRRFRADLMARLEGYTLHLPALRQRREDIVPLFFRIFEQHGGQPAGCEPKFVESLVLYDWPLNVRELALVARRLAAVFDRETLKRSMLPERMLRVPDNARRASSAERRATDDEASFDALVASLREHGGNLTRAASALGLTRARAYRVLEARPDFDLAAMRKAPSE